jgi:hypothetical protein
MTTGWTDARLSLPPPGLLVLVLAADRDTPLCGWHGGGPAPFWRVPGFGGRVLWWCDCVPPLPGAVVPEKVAGTRVLMGP